MTSYHCHKCAALLFKYEDGFIVDGKQLEIKCRSCGAMNYVLSPMVSRVPLTMPFSIVAKG